jgi:hypothetical protein
MITRYRKSLVLGVYSCSHGMVDAACAALVIFIAGEVGWGFGLSTQGVALG